ncbi:MAG: hypothetical protein AAF485_16425 [Chloroflexota bacterium]
MLPFTIAQIYAQTTVMGNGVLLHFRSNLSISMERKYGLAAKYGSAQRLRGRQIPPRARSLRGLWTWAAGQLTTCAVNITKLARFTALVKPERLTDQIDELRQTIQQVERDLVDLNDTTTIAPGYKIYWQGLDAEIAGDSAKATKLYRQAARRDYPDGSLALRSLRYTLNDPKKVGSGAFPWQGAPARPRSARGWYWLLGGAILVILLLLLFNFNNNDTPAEAVALLPSATPTLTPTNTSSQVTLIVPNTATPTPTKTPIFIPPTATNRPTEIPPTPLQEAIVAPTSTPAATLIPAPKIIDPKDGLVWGDGAIVFEFEDMGLDHDQLYCLNTLRGYDLSLTENWSFPPIGSKEPAIPIEAHVFKVAQVQDIKCIVWSAAIGQNSCNTLISESTAERVIGLPHPCQLK